jgi:hypothetical protein
MHDIVYTDNRAAIQAIELTRPALAYHIVDLLHDRYRKLKQEHREVKLTVRWIPGHAGVKGNEEVARKASEGEGPDKIPVRKPIPESKSATKAHFNTVLKLKNIAANVWKNSEQYESIRRIDATLPSDNFTPMTRTGHRAGAD